MRWLAPTAIAVLVLMLSVGTAPQSSRSDTPAFAASVLAKSKCHYVTKKVHGKKKKVKVCTKPKPTATPRPTPKPTSTPSVLHLIDQGGYLWIEAGNIFVSSGVSPTGRVSKLSTNGSLLQTFRSDIDGATGVAVDGTGNLYVVDHGSDRVVKFSSGGAQTAVIGSPQELSGPSGIGFDGNGHLFVADSFNSRIQEFTVNGQYVGAIGSYGDDAGQLEDPHDVVVDAQGNLFVADTQNNRVDKFSSTGAFLTSWGSKGADPGQFDLPAGICLDNAGHVFVADTGNRRIQEFTADGTHVGGWSTGDYQPVSPGVDAAGNVYVTEDIPGGTAGYGVAKYAPDGRLLGVWR